MELYDFQKEIIRQTDGYEEVAYFLGMGLGKTLLAQTHICRMAYKYENVLVVCQKSKILDWCRHWKTNTDYTVLNFYDLKPKELKDIDVMSHIVIVVSYDSVWRRPIFREFAKTAHLVLDESSLIQNEGTKRTDFIMKLEPLTITLLSGTPCAGRYENMWTQCQLLGWDITRTQYWNRYVEWHMEKFYSIPRPIRVVDGYKNVEELKKNLRDYGAVFMTTEEAIELPDKIEETTHVPISDAYKDFRKRWLIEIDGEELVGDTPLNKMLGLRKLASYYSGEKKQALSDILEVNPERIVVFYNFKRELEEIRKIVGKRHFCEINGDHHGQSMFDKYDDCVIAVQYQSGSMGLNLQESHIAVYFSPTLSADLFMQSQARIHRIGQTKKCNYIYLVCENSIEAEIYETLRRREDYVLKLFEKTHNIT